MTVRRRFDTCRAWAFADTLGVVFSLLALCGVLLPVIVLVVGEWHRIRLEQFLLEPEQYLRPALNTLLLALGTLALSVPIGVIVAWLVARTDIACRKWLAAGIVAAVFVPLAVTTSAWHVVFSDPRLLGLSAWSSDRGRMWPEGLLPAIWVHAMAAIPWVFLFTAVGFRATGDDLEQDAATCFSPLGVLLRTSLRRNASAILASILWVFVMTSGEICVTDMFLVRTLAEETYTLFAMGEDEAVARLLLIDLVSAVTLAAVLAPWLNRRLERLPALEPPIAAKTPLQLGNARPIATGLVALVVAVIIGVPVGAMVWRAGSVYGSNAWTLEGFSTSMAQAVLMGQNVAAFTLASGVFCASLCTAVGVASVWYLAGERGWTRSAVLFSVLLLWLLPAPLVGMGVSAAILAIVNAWPAWLLQAALYHGPSPLPTWWAWVARATPAAILLIWPAVAKLPKHMVEAARLEQPTRTARLSRVVLPLTAPALLAAVLIATALLVHELGASKHASTPGVETFTQSLFQKMHIGATREVAAHSLLLVTAVIVGAVEMLARQSALNAGRFNPDRCCEIPAKAS